MTTLAVDSKTELIGAGEYGCPVHTNHSGWNLVPEVRSDDSVGGVFLEETVIDHRQSAHNDFFSRLEDEYQRTRQLIFHPGEYFSCCDRHCDVPVMATGVHSTVGRGKIKSGKFINR